MTRTERLLALLQILRRHRRPVSGRTLAGQLGISLRTLYRDIATLQAQGADIEGEPGVGYILRPGFLLPPLMFSQPEMEALMLGVRWVSTFADRPLARAATDALGKIMEVLPSEVRDGVGAVPLRVGPPASPVLENEDLSSLREAIRRERKVEILYRSGERKTSKRIIWPFAIGYFPEGRILVAWCERSGDNRHFRTDRLRSVKLLDQPYPRRRHSLFRDWQASQFEKLRNGKPAVSSASVPGRRAGRPQS